MFTNITTDPLEVSKLAAYYAIADSNGTAGVVIYTDSQYQIAVNKANAMQDIIKQCSTCTVLEYKDTPIASAQANMPAVVAAELQKYGDKFTYMLAINGNYFAGSRAALVDAGKKGTDAPHAVAAGDGDAAEFQRIRNEDYQAASVAEPLYLQAWQLIDELNRAIAGPAGLRLPRAAGADHQGQRTGGERLRPELGLPRQLQEDLGQVAGFHGSATRHWIRLTGRPHGTAPSAFSLGVAD